MLSSISHRPIPRRWKAGSVIAKASSGRPSCASSKTMITAETSADSSPAARLACQTTGPRLPARAPAASASASPGSLYSSSTPPRNASHISRPSAASSAAHSALTRTWPGSATADGSAVIHAFRIRTASLATQRRLHSPAYTTLVTVTIFRIGVSAGGPEAGCALSLAGAGWDDGGRGGC